MEKTWKSIHPDAQGRELVQLSPELLDALANGDLSTGRGLTNYVLTPFLVSEKRRSTWNYRRQQIKANPQDGIWVTRLLVESTNGTVVGQAGYHGMPNEDGMVEVGYAVDPTYRRLGHARAALRIMLDMASREHGVRVVRASIQPENVASTNLVIEFGFQKVGEQWDEEDGLEVIFERSV